MFARNLVRSGAACALFSAIAGTQPSLMGTAEPDTISDVLGQSRWHEMQRLGPVQLGEVLNPGTGPISPSSRRPSASSTAAFRAVDAVDRRGATGTILG